MRRLTSLSDIPYSIEIRMAPPGMQPGSAWDRKLVLLAKVVGTDGFVRDEDHVIEFGDLKVTKRTVTARWAYTSLARPDEPEKYDNKKQAVKPWEIREVIIPRAANHGSTTTNRRLIAINDRLIKLLAPQHPWLFRIVEAVGFCQDVHKHIVVQDIMMS